MKNLILDVLKCHCGFYSHVEIRIQRGFPHRLHTIFGRIFKPLHGFLWFLFLRMITSLSVNSGKRSLSNTGKLEGRKIQRFFNFSDSTKTSATRY
jgi:hypothetical protein